MIFAPFPRRIGAWRKGEDVHVIRGSPPNSFDSPEECRAMSSYPLFRPDPTTGPTLLTGSDFKAIPDPYGDLSSSLGPVSLWTGRSNEKLPPSPFNWTQNPFIPPETPQPAPTASAGAEKESKADDAGSGTQAPQTWQEAAGQGHLASYAWDNAIKPGLTALYTDPVGTAKAMGSAVLDSISTDHMRDSWLKSQGVGTVDGERDMMPTLMDTLNVAGAGGGVGAARAAAKKTAGLADRAVENSYGAGYNPPSKALRAFEADYPKGAKVDGSGRLLEDIEGRPLNPDALIAGRRYAAGMDEALRPEDVVEGAARLTGQIPTAVAKRSLPRDSVGAYRVSIDPVSGEKGRSIDFYNALHLTGAANVIAHEFGHAIDDMAARIPTKGLNDELRQVYNTLATGRERTSTLTGPQHLGYSSESAPGELMAEAIRAYIQNPNYLKTVAPKTAAAIRQAVNGDPRHPVQLPGRGAGAFRPVIRLE
jgi:hypothetical protein